MKSKRIVVFGGSGLVGSGIARALSGRRDLSILAPSRAEVDLLDRERAKKYLSAISPDIVILAAAKVGGIKANAADPVGFLVENLDIQTNAMMAAALAEVPGLMFLGSSCIYPRNFSQAIPEDALMTGPLEPTNASYSIAKIAGIQLANSLSNEFGIRTWLPMPCNIYGTGDHFDLDRSHVLSALVKRFSDAKAAGDEEVLLWGSGSARREFLHVDDLARACLHLIDLEEDLGLVNVGYGSDVSILELAELVATETAFNGDIRWDTNMPDGVPRKLLDSSRIFSSGWQPSISLQEGVRQTVIEYANLRSRGERVRRK